MAGGARGRQGPAGIGAVRANIGEAEFTEALAASTN